MASANASPEAGNRLSLCNEMIHGKTVLQTVVYGAFSSRTTWWFKWLANQTALRKFLAH
jgi:hypothetical protein